jgi:hypothetical protein
MATQVQFRRGTTSQNNAFTGAAGEFTVDTDVWTIRLHDGTLQGGHTIPTLGAAQTLTNKTMGSGSIWNGSSIALGYGGTGASLSAVAGAVAYSTGSALALSLAGTSGQVLTSGGTSGPTWVNASALSTGTATSAVTAQNILGGSAGYLMYQSDTDTTAFIAPGATGYILKSTGASSAPSWVTPDFTLGSTSVAVGTTQTSFDGITAFYITGTTDSSSSITGVLRVAGGASIAKKLYVGSDLTVTGNLTVNGTTTNINTTNLVVEDKNIILGDVTTPSDTTADGGGITLKGATDKTFNWVDATDSWTSSEHIDVASTKTYKIATVPVLTSTTVLNDSTQTSITVGGYATTVSFGASTGKTTINSTDDASSNSTGAITVAGGVSIAKKLYVGSDTVLTGDLQVKGGDITTDQTTFNLLNATATTLNIGQAATTFGIGANSGTLTVGNPTVVGTQTTQNLWNTTTTTVNAFGAATTIGIGASTGTLTVNNAATVFNSTSNIKLPVGDISQRPGSPSAGMVRYNSEISSFEGYASGAWSSLGGVKSVDGLTYILAETSAGASNDELEFYTATDGSNTAKRGGWNKTRLLVNTPILVSSQASLSEYPNALIISSNGDTTNNEAYIVGVVGEGVASGTDSTQWGVGVYGAGTSKGSTKSAGVIGKGIVYSSSDTGSAVGVRGLATDTHASGLNVGLYSDASGSAVNNYALYMNTGDIFSGAAQTWLLKDNNSAALSLDATGKTGIIKVITTDNAEGVSMSGTLDVTGNFNVNTNKFSVTASSGNTSVAGTLNVTGNTTLTGDLAVNGSDITTTGSGTATVFNTNALTLNMGGAATAVAIGASTGTTTVNNALAVTGDSTLTGDLAVNGGDITTTATTFNLVNATATTLSIGSAAATARLGATSGTLTLGNPTVVGTQTTQNLYNTVATTINLGGAATTINMGSAASGAAVNVGKDLYVAGNLYVTGTQSTGSISTISGADSAIYTNAGNAGNTREIGLIGTYVSASTTYYSGLLRDHNDSVYKFYSTTTAPVAGTTQDFAGATYSVIKHGNSIYTGATSGTITVQATGVAGSNTLTLPAATDTLIGKATTDTLTNKTYDTAGTGNSFKINGTSISDITGTGKVVLDTLPTFGTTGIKFSGSTSGTTQVLSGATAGTSVLTLPVATDTLVGKATTDTFTNKTFNTAGTGNSFSINSNAITGYTGTGATVVLSAAPTITGHPTIEGVTSTGATGTGAFVFGTSPSLTTPTLGVASATSVNKVTITTPATGSTLTLVEGSTLATSGAYSTTLTATGATNVTLPTTGTLATLAGTETFTNKTLTSPTMTTPTLGVASATTINKVTLTTPATGSTLTIADGKTLTASNTLTLTGTDASSVAFGTGGTVAYTANKLSVFASTSSSELAGVISDETGTGVLVFGTAPTFTTSIDGGATFGAFASVTAGTIGYTGTGASSTWNISTAALTGAFTKTLNIGTGGTTGSTTTINIGSSITGQTLIRGGLAVGSTTNTTDGEIRATAAITSYYSDDRLKDRKGNIENALEKVLSLDGFHYTANETAAALGYDSSKEEVGLSAQQVQAVLPEIVKPAPIDDKYLTIQYERMIPLLVEAIKEQQKQIEELKAKLGN